MLVVDTDLLDILGITTFFIYSLHKHNVNLQEFMQYDDNFSDDFSDDLTDLTLFIFLSNFTFAEMYLLLKFFLKNNFLFFTAYCYSLISLFNNFIIINL